MAILSIDVPNAQAVRLADAFGAPPGTAVERLAFVKRQLIAYAKDRLGTYEANVAADAARTKADVEVNPT